MPASTQISTPSSGHLTTLAQPEGACAMNPFLILGLAIGAEVAATLALKAADGLTRPGPTLIVAVGYGTALWLMSTSMDMLPIGVVYAIWSGVGMIGAAIGGAWLYGEAVSPTMLVGIAVIAVGVTILAAGQGQH